MVKGISITPTKVVTEVEVDGLKDYQQIVQGLIQPCTLADGSTMYVNEEFLFQFTRDDFNSIATDVALLGRHHVGTTGILGPVLIVGPLDADGYDTDITDQARRWVRRVAREA